MLQGGVKEGAFIWSENRRNFKAGIPTNEENLVAKVAKQFDENWMGKQCTK